MRRRRRSLLAHLRGPSSRGLSSVDGADGPGGPGRLGQGDHGRPTVLSLSVDLTDGLRRALSLRPDVGPPVGSGVLGGQKVEDLAQGLIDAVEDEVQGAGQLGVVEPGPDVGEDLGAQAQAGVVNLGVKGGDEPAAGDLLGHGAHPGELRGARPGGGEPVVGAHGEDPAVDHHEHVVESGHREVHHPLGQIEVVAVAAHGQPGGEPPEGHGRGHRPLRLIPPGHQSSSQVTSSGKRSSTVEKKARVMPRPMSMKASSWAWLMPAPT